MAKIANIPRPKQFIAVPDYYQSGKVTWCARVFCNGHLHDTQDSGEFYYFQKAQAVMGKNGQVEKVKKPVSTLSMATLCCVCGFNLFSGVAAQPQTVVPFVTPAKAIAAKVAEKVAESETAPAKSGPSAADYKEYTEKRYQARYTEDEEGNVVPNQTAQECSASYASSIHKVPTFNLDKLTEIIEKINKKAKKTGVKMCTVEYGDVVTETRTHIVETEDGPREIRFPVSYQYLKVAGETPRVDGWDFICAMEHTSEGNIVTSAPNQTAPVEARNMKPNCEHCNVKTRRNDTFILQNQSGVQKQVGRNCLADFLGGQSPESLIASVESLRKLLKGISDCEESAFGACGGRSAYPLQVFLAYVVHSIAKHGWVSRGVAHNDESKTSTATDAQQTWDMANNPFTPPSKRYFPTEEEFETAKLAAEWAVGLAGTSDYENNIKIIAKIGTYDPKRAGFAASIVSGYQKSLVDAKLAAAKPVFAPSTFQGEVGKKIEIKVLVLASIGLEGTWGSTQLYIMRDAAGNIYKWNASNGNMEKGGEYTVRGSIKAHEEYKGTQQTVLQRCVSFTDKELVELAEVLKKQEEEKKQKAAEAKAAKAAAKKSQQIAIPAIG